ncbi:hypothetical protein OF377_01395 [Ureaplasma sp. ES3154-GEN]|uniref:Vmc-like lipoprotein signal peptide domain-containing protein n=1 Tax=Ureaplasma sp. ES3154-GEN TaxID=2984844 RepID=UPI0021E8B3ED|nr:hypothetical protein [Ureaplasma sp. ES3154-GEN]MCV3743542.1 hypothetical protein [Ureaplasma sp. ES3154-GEN]
MNKKQKRILGLVFGSFAIAAITIPVAASCSKKDKYQEEFNKLLSEYKKLIPDASIANITLQPIEIAFKEAKTDEAKSAVIESLKTIINATKLMQLS